MTQNSSRVRVGVISTYLPRRCGLATYTADLCQALTVADPSVEAYVIAIDRDQLDYGTEVLTTIDQGDVVDYAAAAETISENGLDVVMIQHEYGIFGGQAGAHVLGLARALVERGIPYLVTLHTVLSRPTAGQAATLRALCAKAARVTVFTHTARRIAVGQGLADQRSITVVPHGAPTELRSGPVSRDLGATTAAVLDNLGTGPVLSTFGLVGPGKGIDVAVSALADVVPTHPDVRYVIAGATHPEIVRRAGESYRAQLTAQVHQLRLDEHVHFIDTFLSTDELATLLRRTDIFLTPYREPEQVCSGALTFALAAGCPVVATSYRYAEDMLRAGAGRLVPFDDPKAMASAVNTLLDDPEALSAARRAADTIGSRLSWPSVAVHVAALLREVVAQRTTRTPAPVATRVVPALNLNHLDRLTDEIGIIQFAEEDEPDRTSGYCVDDVARLAVVSADLLAVRRETATAKRWLRQCVRFLHAAHQDAPVQGMHNQLSYAGAWQDQPHLGDHVGRAMWGLGVVAGTTAVPGELRRSAAHLLDELAPVTGALTGQGLRAVAYAIIGLSRAGRVNEHLALGVRHLDDALRAGSADDPDWRWYESTLTYDNPRLPQALLAGATLLGWSEVAGRALDSLNWIIDQVDLDAGVLHNVGNRWRQQPGRESSPDEGDEQPLDAAAAVEALVDAWYDTDDPRYARLAGWAYNWFLGSNRAGVRLYTDASGGCLDGLAAGGANRNQGAESTLAYHQALLSMVRAGLAGIPDQVALRGTRTVRLQGLENLRLQDLETQQMRAVTDPSNAPTT